MSLRPWWPYLLFTVSGGAIAETVRHKAGPFKGNSNKEVNQGASLGGGEKARVIPVAKLQKLADEYVWLWNAGNPILCHLRDRIFSNMDKNRHLMYKTIANEAGLQSEPLTVYERLKAIVG